MAKLTERELERIMIRDNLCVIDDSVIAIDDLIAKYGTGLIIDIDHDYCYGDCELTIFLRVERLETDEEYEARIEKLKRHKATQAEAARKRRETLKAKKLAEEVAERELYDRLRAKYGADGL